MLLSRDFSAVYFICSVEANPACKSMNGIVLAEMVAVRTKRESVLTCDTDCRACTSKDRTMDNAHTPFKDVPSLAHTSKP